jgi:hypothetical protein
MQPFSWNTLKNDETITLISSFTGITIRFSRIEDRVIYVTGKRESYARSISSFERSTASNFD